MKTTTKTLIRTIIALVAPFVLVLVQGCGVDPLVYDGAGAMRSSISLEDVEDASLPSCDCIDSEFLESDLFEWSVVPVRGAEDFVVIVASGQAVCFDGEDAGPTPEPSNPEGDRQFSAGPTPEPSTPTGGRGVTSGPTPEPSSEGRIFSQGPTPEPSKDFPVTSSSFGNTVGPTPEPSLL